MKPNSKPDPPPITGDLLTDHLPLPFLRPELIPPAPNQSDSGTSIDFLPDFSGYAWVGYGASSLLVISHFPSPLSSSDEEEPIFRQVIEICDEDEAVNAVSWSPVTPSKGEIAAAAGNRVFVLSCDFTSGKGSFCWSQTAVLLQVSEAVAINWTGSGDGLVTSGNEVVLWKRQEKSWERAWKFKTQQLQTLVSTTFSIEGPSATAATYGQHVEGSFPVIIEAAKCVSVFLSFGKSEYVKAELHHPQPVSMIQWRPITKNQLSSVKQTPRNVLLTCCRDGAARLWCETDNGKPKKNVKESNDQKPMKLSFCVVAVIEINQTLSGSLGIDIFIAWPTEVDGMFNTHERASQCSSTEANEGDYVPRCEWLVGFGSGLLLSFWAIHCLDDYYPVRFPRVTLWNKQEVPALQIGYLGISGITKESTVNKALITRNTHFAPPTICSLIRLLPNNSLGWSLVYTNTSNDTLEEETSLLYQAERYLDIDGHCGKILRVAVHSYCLDIELAASLDSNGRILLWSFSKSSNNFSGLPTLNPAWKLCGKLICGTSCPKYTSLRWAPSGNEDQFLLLGHASGIDCFVVKIPQKKDKVEYQNLGTIPFTSHATNGDGPDDIFSIPLHSNCNETINNDKFILVGVWTEEFQALSWEISLHCCSLSGSCCKCNLKTKDNAQKSVWAFETSFADKHYCFNVSVQSSELPEADICNYVTSYALPTQANQIFIRQVQAYTDVTCFNDPPFHLITGFYDGSVKLWRCNPRLPWEVVGSYVAHMGPVRAISLSDCGQKIATVCKTGDPNNTCSLHIWDSIRLTSSGCFILEDVLKFEDVIGLSWLTIENGQSLLEVSMKNQLQVYGQQRFGGLSMLADGSTSAKHVWGCLGFILTSSTIYDFLWRPSAAAIIVHGDYFGLLGPSLFVADSHDRGAFNKYVKDIRCVSDGETNKELIPTYFSYSDDIEDPKHSNRKGKNGQHVHVNVKNSQPSNHWFLGRAQVKCGVITKPGSLSILEVAEKLMEPLPVYHPEALLMNICSGNWRRASTAIRHVAKHLPSSCSSEAIPQIDLSDYFEGQLPDSFSDKRFHLSENATAMTSSSMVDRNFSPFAYNAEPDANISVSFMKKTEVGCDEPLEKLVHLEGLSNLEKTQIFSVRDLLKEINDSHLGSVYRGLDIPGQRFWVAVRYKQLYFHRKYNKLASMEELLIDSSIFAWAFHSDCQENLFTSVLPNEPSWPEMRNVGVGFWFTDSSQLRTKMEKLARFQYLKNRDPKACALLYIALKRIQVLAGLYKISKDEKDKPLVGFLSRNFQEEKNKAAALKNAYVLMGRHQLELAISFFLLGGDTSSAVTVCAKNLGDEQLALVICRLIEGHGGPLERDIISKYILPSAIERGDYWLASLLEWELGAYSQSFLIMHGIQKGGPVTKTTLPSLSGAFSDPSVGQFCLALATKNSLRNAVGEHESAIMGRWASSMTAAALNRCGLPLEGLEYISSPQNAVAKDHESLSENDHVRGQCKIMNTLTNESPNWHSGDVAFHFESRAKLNFAVKSLSPLIREHPCWPDHGRSTGGTTPSKEFELHQYQTLLENFHRKFYTEIAILEKFFVSPAILVRMIVVSLCNKEMFYIGYDILHGFTLSEQSDMVDGSMLHPLLQRLLLKATKEMAHLFSQFIFGCTLNSSMSIVFSSGNNVPSEIGSFWLDSFACNMQGIIHSVRTARVIFGKVYSLPSKDLIKEPFPVLDMVEYCIYFSVAWVQRNLKGLMLMVQPLRIKCDGDVPAEIDMETWKKLLHQMAKLVISHPVIDTSGGELQVLGHMPDAKVENLKSLRPVDERWQNLGACLWQQLSNFVKLYSESESGEDGDGSSVTPLVARSSGPSGLGDIQADVNREANQIRLVLFKFLKVTLEFVSAFHTKQLRLLLQQKVEQGLNTKSVLYFDTVSQSQSVTPHMPLTQNNPTSEILNNEDEADLFDKLWNTCTDSDTTKSIAQENVNLIRYNHKKPFKTWVGVYEGVLEERRKEETYNQVGANDSNPSTSQAEVPRRGLFRNGPYFSGNRSKDATPKGEAAHFQEPKEIYKINGELFEALCINSTDQRQVALASNRKLKRCRNPIKPHHLNYQTTLLRFSWYYVYLFHHMHRDLCEREELPDIHGQGILFIHREDEGHSKNHSGYIWSKTDWPQNGWAGSESTPVPTCVSPGIGLGTKKGAHLGLGGATVGVGSIARPGRDLTGGGTFGIPGYAGMGASGLGWETQEDFEEFVDLPANVRNISTRALSSHPSRPYFLVGSSNTHVYLWEFGKAKAIATYGVLPAANVAPPYALASISAVQFDHYGHRFATAALDGTICTWQLEVGGRSNVRPTESSLCFNSHASDVTYVTSSGSIIAASGYSTDGVNVVVWDTLAPHKSSQASIMCHEGGARSLSVFDNDIGSGSISPLIVTGGRGGDIALHDFRYIATGKAKRHRHLNNSEHKSRTASSSETSTSGDQNINGMLWYLPKAHLGSITRISTIPNTSLFLTGSKDGDVKLWDAQKAKLVYHWPRLHERHTFLQPSSRGFGGVAQAAVTDIQVVRQGFLSCGGDGSVKHVQFSEPLHRT